MRILTLVTILLVGGCTIYFSSCKKNEKCEPECLNEGTCIAGECNCINGYSGDKCEIEPIDTTLSPNPCEGIVCNNGGTCVNGSCACEAGFEGLHCDSLSRTKFLITGAAATRTLPCGWMAVNFLVDILPGDSVHELVMKVPYGYPIVDYLNVEAAMTSPYTFTIPYQVLIYDSVGSYQLNIEHGLGTLSGNVLTVTYEQRTASLGGTNYCDSGFVIQL